MTQKREPAIRMIAMPADANPRGDIFGGYIMSLMDMAGGNVAFRRAGGRSGPGAQPRQCEAEARRRAYGGGDVSLVVAVVVA